ncbi:phosphoadenylyl-sulfate reductase [Myxococcota bacterium]|nr:phosphoadenylyl-sulfate reductase [Myxococcota bacterium]
MHITMVKKRLADGQPCEKCAQAEEMLVRRGLWERIDEVLWAIEGDPTSPGAILAEAHGLAVAPFFVVRDTEGEERVLTSALRLVRDCLSDSPETGPRTDSSQSLDVSELARRFSDAAPEDIVRWGIEQYGQECAIALRGGEEVVLIDMATRMGLPFSVFSVDTGRLDEETYTLFDTVQRRYGVTVHILFPDAHQVEELVQQKGPNCFLTDGHEECCRVRRLGPLKHGLKRYQAWMTGRWANAQPAGQAPVAVEIDPVYQGARGQLLRLNPLVNFGHERVWHYIRQNDVPYNELFDRGYTRIGCQPCTRATGGVHGEREVRWWWERPKPTGSLHETGDGI